MMTRLVIAVAAVLVVFPLALMLLAAAQSQPATAAAAAPSAAALEGIPADYLTWYMAAAQTCPGLPWPVLAGVGTVESDNGQSSAPGVHSGANFAGAEGPMQFEPATFAEYAVNADPGSPLTPYDPRDAIFAAARMLCASGARGGSPAGIRQAVYAYNHAGWYVTEILEWAAKYAAPVQASEVAARAIAFAEAQLGKPYQWGAAGPDTYDCSGLTMEAWAQAGVALLHYTGYQWEEGPHVSLDDLEPGDLLFYATDNSDPATIHHVGIYIGNGEMVDAPYTGAFVRIDSIYQPGIPIGAVDPAG
jgi:cell wall-associated NlpC family hydrolase